MDKRIVSAEEEKTNIHILTLEFKPLTLPKDLKCLLCRFDLHLGAAGHIHIMIEIFAKDFGLRRSEGKNKGNKKTYRFRTTLVSL